jgi:hypothetical protein
MTGLSTKKLEKFMIISLVLTGILIIFNQIQLSAISSSFDSVTGATSKSSVFLGFGGKKSTDLSSIDVTEITSTAMALASLFPELDNINNDEDAISVMIPTGTPEYSEALGGITFDDPVNSMEYLAKWYHNSNSEIKENYPEIWQRYLNLAAAPRGISCEFCCGLNAQGITAEGRLMCGCKHQPALLAVTVGLMQNTDYSDAEILREVMKWKTIWFPRNMIGLAMEVAGTDPSQLKELPGMVGGC